LSWLQISPDDVVSRLTETERLQCDTADVTGTTLTQRLPTIITAATHYIRGKVAKFPNTRRQMGPSGTIPDELYLAALNLVRWELLNALPNIGRLEDDPRRGDYEQALKDFEAAGDGDLVILGANETSYVGDDSIVGGDKRIGWFKRYPFGWRGPAYVGGGPRGFKPS
jgi:Protein of unknown function (DUF1320)